MNRVLEDVARRWVLPFADLRRVASIASLPKFFRDMKRYRTLAAEQSVSWRDAYPCLVDGTTHTPFDPHYFHQGAWLARRLLPKRPPFHVDVGSSVMMVSVLSGAIPMVFVDYRPLSVRLSGLHAVAADAIRLPFADEALTSLSCLHVIEHIGLGRYGDPIDPQGSLKAAAELQRILRPGGKLFLSLPIGRERVCFNAHRVYAPDSVIQMFAQVRLIEFSYVDDAGELREDRQPASAGHLHYGCGLFIFEKS